MAGYNADIAEQSQVAKTQAIQRQGSLRLGAQRAALAASGSSLDVLGATEDDTARAANASQYQGDLTGYGYRTQQQNFTNQGAMETATTGNASTAGILSASGTIVSNAGQVADRWYQFKTRVGSNSQTPTAGDL